MLRQGILVGNDNPPSLEVETRLGWQPVAATRPTATPSAGRCDSPDHRLIPAPLNLQASSNRSVADNNHANGPRIRTYRHIRARAAAHPQRRLRTASGGALGPQSLGCT